MQASKGPTDNTIPIVLCIIILATVLAPVLRAGYYTDDNYNSLVYEVVHSKFHGSLGEIIYSYSYGWMLWGRLYPIGVAISYIEWYYLGWDVIYIKLLNIAVVILSGVAAYQLVHRLTSCISTSLLTLLLLSLTIQTRIHFDPITSYPLLVTFVLLMTLWQAIAFDIFCGSKNRSALVGSAAMHAIILLTYEVAIIAILLNIAVLLRHHFSFKKGLRFLSSHFCITIVYFSIVIALRLIATETYKGIALGSWSAIPMSFLINFYGGSRNFIEGPEDRHDVVTKAQAI